ncbi:prespore-specific regulator [Paenibacillus rhizosphaerae]|uniref:Prespore-specific regulator n=1 Tax=Paenibacillus rhizosphaerae TaxID=297318 RepID=A0A839TYF0_9BACL|nr:RsfA family transcriptional regulator [Paenibacillus rhizosphaerae]MBB3132294.1 prespore-specific regulator [Paenibacillus rhizosphaerae]
MQRQDGWTLEDDICLSETVINCIEQGETQLNAFKLVAKKTNRTPAACGFRWNSNLRKKYEQQINQAKLKRKQAQGVLKKHPKLSVSIPSVKTYVPEIDIDQVISSLQALKEQLEGMRTIISSLQNRNVELEQQLNSKPSDVTEDMRNLLEIIRRAEKLGLTNKEKPAI